MPLVVTDRGTEFVLGDTEKIVLSDVQKQVFRMYAPFGLTLYGLILLICYVTFGDGHEAVDRTSMMQKFIADMDTGNWFRFGRDINRLATLYGSGLSLTDLLKWSDSNPVSTRRPFDPDARPCVLVLEINAPDKDLMAFRPHKIATAFQFVKEQDASTVARLLGDEKYRLSNPRFKSSVHDEIDIHWTIAATDAESVRLAQDFPLGSYPLCLRALHLLVMEYDGDMQGDWWDIYPAEYLNSLQEEHDHATDR